MKVHKIPLMPAYTGQSTYIDYKYNVIKINSVFTLMKMEKLKLSKLTIYSVQQVELALLNTLNLSNINARFEDLKKFPSANTQNN